MIAILQSLRTAVSAGQLLPGAPVYVRQCESRSLRMEWCSWEVRSPFCPPLVIGRPQPAKPANAFSLLFPYSQRKMAPWLRVLPEMCLTATSGTRASRFYTSTKIQVS